MVKIDKPLVCGTLFFMEYWENTDIQTLEGEEWRDAPDYNGYYKISNYGRVKSLARYPNAKDKIMKLCLNTAGYPSTRVSKLGVGKHLSAHRWVAIAFIPNPKNKPEVNHKFGIKWDNRHTELEWNTTKENAIHAVKNKLRIAAKGEKQQCAILTSEQVVEMRNNYIRGKYGQTKYYAQKFNVTYAAIREIINGRSWKHLL